MFLLITEDMMTFKTENLTMDDKIMADEGLVDIIDMDKHLKYYDGTWNEIETYVAT